MIRNEKGCLQFERFGRRSLRIQDLLYKMNMLDYAIPAPKGINIDCPCCGRHNRLLVYEEGTGFRCAACDIKGNDIMFYWMLKMKQPPDVIISMVNNGLLNEKEAVDEYYSFMGQKGKSNYRPTYIKPVKRVDVDNVILPERDLTYNALLDRLEISKPHMDNLLARGLRPQDIENNRYRTVPKIGHTKIAADLRKNSYNLEGVPGFFKRDNIWSVKKMPVGFFIPVRDIPEHGQEFGLIQGMQIRFDTVTEGDTRYKWFSTGGFENGSPASTFAHVSGNPDYSQYAILTEGPLKADIIHSYLEHCVVAVPGVNSQKNLEEMLPRLYDRGIRVFYMAFDMDYRKNTNVMTSYTKMVKMLYNNGFRVERFLWDENYKGLDDYLTHVYKTRGR